MDRSDVLFGMTGWHTVWSQAIDERRATDPAVPVQQLFRESKELGCTGSLNLLYRYITQGRAEGERPVTTPRRLTRLLLTHPGRLRDSDTRLVQELTTWITTIRVADLPHLHGFANGIELDRAAVNAALTLPYHNGRTEGVNTRTKRIMRQMHGRAGFDLLRHRILLP
ncbi:hypothetical protein H4W80_000501 [Nonomuraea angiospora]|uniref:Transposase IS204/IS1001/IS1096/IS1165 DDE domain-containing protein n=1 Tax=Nonomuraea angiospora TaxID=46172 RepID=A0ABR9LNL7_9ACTN|nr:hypothetical protein [Nonomuraea angiospora]